MTPIASQDLGYGITCLDTEYSRPGLAACYLMVENGKAAFIDTGTFFSVPGLLNALTEQGLTPSDVEFIIPTHVHLDHAGGAGELMRHCPNARLVAHPRGAPHLIDPARLKAGALAVYGEAAFEAELGDLIPVPKERVISAPDQTRVALCGRELLFLDTPGHASHHFCVYDDASRGCFTGDTFGIAYPELAGSDGPYLFPPTTPVQFNPTAWHDSLDKLLALDPERMYLTHYGMVTNIPELAKTLKRRINEYAELALARREEPDPKTAIEAALADQMSTEIQAAGNSLQRDQILELLAMDLDLNAQGLTVWLQRQS